MPLGVVLHVRGLAIGCHVLRDEDQDRRGETAWVAVPDEPVTIRTGEEFTVTATFLPDGCALIADILVPDSRLDQVLLMMAMVVIGLLINVEGWRWWREA